MKRTAEEAAETRKGLLTAALRVFGQSGYHAAKLKDIAEEAGVTRGAIYHHFENKAGLYQALLDSANLAVGGTIVPRAAAEGGTFLEILERVLVRTFKAVATDAHLRDTMRLYLFQSDFSGELAPIAERLRDSAVTSVENLVPVFQMGVAQDELRSDVDVRVITRSLVAFQNGVIQLWLLNPDAFSLEESAYQFAAVFLAGVAVR